MESDESTKLDERLKSLLSHLYTESGILDRLVYKNKNQHRRCPYFQLLLKVRRDLKLFHSAGLSEILTVMFQVIDGKKPAQKAFLPKKHKKNNPKGKHNYQERLLGVARLLSQMSEPILNAAIQISFLLAKSFFTGFSLTTLALLARLRVLVQQILLDVVMVFNKVSSLSVKKHLVKLTQGGIESFREYYPSDGEVLTLECVWKTDKFVLLERAGKSNIKNEMQDQGPLPSETPLKYETIHLFGEEDADHLSFKRKTGLEDDESPTKKNSNSMIEYSTQQDGSATVGDNETISIGKMLKMDDDQSSKIDNYDSGFNFAYNCEPGLGKRLRGDDDTSFL